MTIRAVIVDDEELARRGLRARLQRTADFQVVAECTGGRDAIAVARELAPDVVFLDIQMPEVSGFDVARALGSANPAHVVFVTAYDQYAVQAFEVHALDYLIKPLDDQRFTATLDHVRAALNQARDSDLGNRLAALLCGVGSGHSLPATTVEPGRLAVRTAGRVVLVDIMHIDWVEASGDYVAVHVGKKSWLVRETVSAMYKRLAPHGFLRIHRSTLVRADRVHELRPLLNGEFTVVLNDGTELKLSRNYRDALEALTGDRL
jgi:two-component system LytT family response regulator